MGQLIKLPNCQEIPPEISRLIQRRTQKTSERMRHWHAQLSLFFYLIQQMDPGADDDALYYIELCLMSYLTDRNRAVLKALGV
jgi:hypothetical protein